MNQFWKLFTLGGLIIAYCLAFLAQIAGLCALSWSVVLAPIWIPVVCAFILFFGFWLKIGLVILVSVFKFKLYKIPFLK